MLNSLKKIFQNNQSLNKNDGIDELSILCGLMVEAANTDGVIIQDEVNQISSILINIFKEDPTKVEKILTQTLKNKDEPKSLHYFTSRINKSFDLEKKLLRK